MEIIKGQTLYQCSYCGKRLLTKRGANLHERLYCHGDSNPWRSARKIVAEERQRSCEHKNTETIYSYIPGECVKEPDCEICIDCGAVT